MYEILVKDLPYNLCGIYKIDYPNNKTYIGLSENIKRRFWEHNNPSNNKQVCDKAIRKYLGKVEKITILEECVPSELGENEKFWIALFRSNEKDKGYNISPGGEHQRTRSVFTDVEVINIRRRKANGERKRDVYQDYKDRAFNTFEKVWLGQNYYDVGKKYLEQCKRKTRQEYSSEANRGERNNKAKLTESDVRQIRQLYKQGLTVTEIQEQFNFVTWETINRVCKKITWKHIE